MTMVNTFYVVWTTLSAFLTMSTATIVALSILTDHWESISYIKERINKVALVRVPSCLLMEKNLPYLRSIRDTVAVECLISIMEVVSSILL